MGTVPAGHAEQTQPLHNFRSQGHVLARVRNEDLQTCGSPPSTPTWSRRHPDSGCLLQKAGDLVSGAACVRLRNRRQATQDPRRNNAGVHENCEYAILKMGRHDSLFDLALNPHGLRRAMRHERNQEISPFNRPCDIGRPINARVHIKSGMRKSVPKSSGPGSVVLRVRQEHSSKGFRHATSSLQLDSASLTKSL